MRTYRVMCLSCLKYSDFSLPANIDEPEKYAPKLNCGCWKVIRKRNRISRRQHVSIVEITGPEKKPKESRKSMFDRLSNMLPKKEKTT